MLLDNARITEEQKTIVQASIQNSQDYDQTVRALKYLHNRIHEGESPVKKDGGKGSVQRPYKPYGKGGKSRGKGKGKYHKKYHKHVANIADEDDAWDDHDETEDDWYNTEEQDYDEEVTTNCETYTAPHKCEKHFRRVIESRISQPFHRLTPENIRD